MVSRSIPMKARVLVADEHPFLRQGVIQFLNQQPDLETCGEADDLARAVGLLETTRPNLILLGLRLGSGDVLEFIKSVRARFTPIFILVFSALEEGLYAERVLRAGAHGYVMKREASEEVLAAIRKVLQGELYVSRSVASALITKLLLAAPRPGPTRLECLSDREFQVYQMLGTGLGSWDIARELNLSIKTIETYRENIKHKFGLRNAAELVRHATTWMQADGAGGTPFRRDALAALQASALSSPGP